MPVTASTRAKRRSKGAAEANTILQDVRSRVYDPVLAENVRALLRGRATSFDGEDFLRFVSDHPAFSRLHLVSEDE